jgi:putative Mg2+ transporter-C (MgtC) family protein
MFRVLLAAIMGGAVGFDRQLRSKPAGVRTHMLVAMGSALAVGVSVLVTQDIVGVGKADAVRVAAGVVTGVGFLGAGTILRSSEGIRGLTTAAGIWVTATIGIALGFGYYWIAVGSTALAVIIIGFLIGPPQPEAAGAQDP